MKESRRSLIGKIGAVGIASTGITGIVGATRKNTDPSNVHPDDKMVVTKEELRNQPEMRKFFQQSPIYKSKAVGPNKVLFYIDLKSVNKEIDYAELSTSGEISISEQLRNTSRWEDLQEKAKKQKKEVDNSIESSIEQKSEEFAAQSGGVGTHGHNGDIIETGVDERLHSNDYYDSGTSGVWGDKDSNANISNDHLHTEIAQAPSYGNAWAWAYVADEFEVSGSSEEFCSITSSVAYDGYLWSAANGKSQITITWKLENLTTGNVVNETHLNESYTAATSTNYLDSTDSDSTTVQLTPGEHYRATVRAEAHTSIATTQGATVDFGNIQDGSQHVDARYYDFDFS